MSYNSVTHCPHCGKPLKKMVFENTAPVEIYDAEKASVFAEAVNFAARFAVISGGSLLVIWALEWPVVWAAPVIGLGGTIALVVLEIKHKPAPLQPTPKKTKVEITVTERPEQGRSRTLIDVFQGVRIEQLTRFADGYLNKGIAPSRRQMNLRANVSEGQSDKIKTVLIDNGWAISGGDYDTAPVVINWKGRAILREVLRQVGK